MEFIRRHFKILSLIALFVVVGVTVLSFYSARKLKFDYDFESFFPAGDPDLDVYKGFRKTFEYDNEYVLIAVENNRGIFKKDFLQRVQTLTDSLQRLPDITSVTSPTTASNFVKAPFGYMRIACVHIDDSTQFANDSALIYRSPEWRGTLFADDAKSVSLFLKTTEGISKEKSDRLLARMEKLLTAGHFDKVRMAGKINGQKVYLDRLQHEFLIFFISSFVLVVLFLWISFRSFWGIWVPIVVVLLSIVWTLGLMQATGKSLDIMTVLLPTMMFVVGMSDVVHIVTKYMEELREGSNRFDALVKTIREAGFATFLTLLTTAIGFLTLLNSSIKPVNDFGIYTSIGVFVAFFLAYAIMPVVLNNLRTPNLKLNQETSQFWNRRLHRLLAWVFRNRKWVGWGTVLITGISLFGIFQIRLNNYLIEGLMRGDSLREDFRFFETHYAGVRPFEMMIRPKNANDSVLSPTSLRAIDRLENFLRKDYGAGFLITPASFVKAFNKAEEGGDPAAYRLPASDSAITALVDELSDLRRHKQTRDFITKHAEMGRISGKMHDIGSMNIRVLNARLDSFLLHTPEMKTLDCRITGGAAMLDKDNEYLVSNMLQSLALSVLAVALIIALIHRSWKLVIISIVPNIVPIFVIGGAMGFFGVDLKSSTSIIFSIAFGIATDDTIHFLARLRLEQLKGKSMIYAVKRTFISTGKAVVVTSLILSAGFLTLVASGFESTFYFGLLVSVTLLIAVLADLLLFPLLCVWLLHEKK